MGGLLEAMCDDWRMRLVHPLKNCFHHILWSGRLGKNNLATIEFGGGRTGRVVKFKETGSPVSVCIKIDE